MTGSTYLDFDRTLNKAFKMIKDDKDKSFALLVICGINLGLRIDDLTNLTFEDLRKDTFTITEGKTNKTRTLAVNDHIKTAVSYFSEDVKGFAFISQKGTRFSSQHLNRKLKEAFKGIGSGKVTTHSLRKCFGRRVFESNGESEKSLVYLSQLFNHSSTLVTRTYLGIQQEELNDIYNNL
ncbi:tyrosine-type recombinase/integrase [Arenibacter nanhaiticus]|nr:tyrosine-type recombinase/integrase [Arenibacter nanhaiticus]